MRAATATLILLGLSSLSCGVFQRFEAPDALAAQPSPASAMSDESLAAIAGVFELGVRDIDQRFVQIQKRHVASGAGLAPDRGQFRLFHCKPPCVCRQSVDLSDPCSIAVIAQSRRDIMSRA